ncbi:spermidine synthase [Luteimicrobium subarcticum]|uniref:spermidine synthase n=1 Tax=Luteimicrobium subarcticum TaxID=620910 RepID=UPI0012FD4E30|nr:fused MFS/spermidine synthase [Luteimicrobium subarcticum]
MSRSTRRRTPARPGSRGAPTRRAADLPTGPLPTTTGTVELVPDPDRNAVTVHVNGVPSSYVDLDDPGLLTFEYMQQMAAVIDGSAPPGPLRAVHLGAAGCSLPRWVEHSRPGSTQTAVDLDTELLERAREWFDLPRAPRLRLRPGDARAVLATLRDGSADVVVRDVFAGDRTPDHLTTTGMAHEVWRVLTPDGLYLVNCADRPPLALARAEVATLRAAGARDVVMIAEPAVLRGRRYGNLVLAARPPRPPDDDGQRADDAPVPLADDAALARALRTLAVPARALGGAELTAFAGTTPPRHDEPADPATPPPTEATAAADTAAP